MRESVVSPSHSTSGLLESDPQPTCPPIYHLYHILVYLYNIFNVHFYLVRQWQLYSEMCLLQYVSVFLTWLLQLAIGGSLLSEVHYAHVNGHSEVQ